MMTIPTPQSFPSGVSDDYIPGMSDEEELRRIGNYAAQSDGLGEEIYDDFDKQALQDLVE